MRRVAAMGLWLLLGCAGDDASDGAVRELAGVACTSTADCAPAAHCSVDDGDCGPLPGCGDGRVCPAVCAGICLPDDGSPPDDPCAGLDQERCAAAVGCEAIYASPPCDGEVCAAVVVYEGCRRAYAPVLCGDDDGCGDDERCTAADVCDAPPCTGICVPIADAQPAVCAPVAVAGTWSAPGDVERRYHFAANGKFVLEDLVAPCPAGATCVWSGIVDNRGAWSESRGGVSLTFTPPIVGFPGLEIVTALSVEGCSPRTLVEAHTGRRFTRRAP